MTGSSCFAIADTDEALVTTKGVATSSQLHSDQPPSRQTLLFDADDTLWENNISVERAIAAFISYLDLGVRTQEEVREHLNTVERAAIAAHSCGLKSFRRSLPPASNS